MRPISLVIGLALCPLIAASADRLNVKTGLWEITSSADLTGLPPLPQEMLDSLSPEQLAQIRQAIAQAGTQNEVSRECVTERDLAEPFHGARPEDCTHKIVRSSRTTQEVQLTCTGEVRGTGTFTINAPNPQTMHGILDLTAGDGERTMKLKATMKGRWLGSDCGEEADDEDDEDSEEDEG